MTDNHNVVPSSARSWAQASTKCYSMPPAVTVLQIWKYARLGNRHALKGEDQSMPSSEFNPRILQCIEIEHRMIWEGQGQSSSEGRDLSMHFAEECNISPDKHVSRARLHGNSIAWAAIRAKEPIMLEIYRYQDEAQMNSQGPIPGRPECSKCLY